MELFGPWFWLLLLLAFVAIEIFTFQLTTIWCAIAALPMIFISLTKMDMVWQLLIFVAISLVLLIFTRPFAVKKLKIGKEKTNMEALVGQHVIVTKEISKFSKGQAKTTNGVIWSVQANSDSPIPEGSECEITQILGNTLEIKPL